jgi:hypothetical protein
MSREGSKTNLQKLGQRFPVGQIPNISAPTEALQSKAMDFRSAGASPSRPHGGPNVLPFEFRALEVCLEAACSCLDAEVEVCPDGLFAFVLSKYLSVRMKCLKFGALYAQLYLC